MGCAILLFVVTASVVLSSRFGESGLARFVRLDDLLLPITAITVALHLGVLGRALITIFPFLLLYALNLLVATAVHFDDSFATELELYEKFLPALKGIQYLAYFLLAYCALARTNRLKDARLLTLLLLGIFGVDLAYGTSQLITGDFRGYYGVAIFNEVSPTLTGAVFFFSAVYCSLNLALHGGRKSTLFIFLLAISVVLAFFSGSRGASIATFVYLLVLTILTSSARTKILIAVIPFIAVAAGLWVYVNADNLQGSVLRVFQLSALPDELESAGTRSENWGNVLSGFLTMVHRSPILLLTGLGSGGTYIIFGEILNAADSQLVATFVAGGLIGSILYLGALLHLYRRARMSLAPISHDLLAVFIALFWAANAFSVTQEVFILSKTGGLFWLTAGLLLGFAESKPASPLNARA